MHTLRTIGIHATVFFCTVVLVWCISLSAKVNAQEAGEMFPGQGGQNSVEQPAQPGESFSGQGGQNTNNSNNSFSGENSQFSGENSQFSGQNSQTQSGSGGSRGLTNPLKFDSLTGFLLAIVDIILILAVPIIILFIIYAGFLMVTAQGNESKLETAKSALLWAVVGGVIVLGARVILKIVEGTVEGFKV